MESLDTLVDLLRVSAARYGGRIALSLPGPAEADTWSYDRVWGGANAVAHHFRNERGFAHGDRVILIGPNSPQLVTAYFGAMLGGIVVVPLDPSSTEDFIERVERDTEARLILSGFPADDERSRGRTPLSALPFESARTYAGEAPKATDIAEVVFTSGTTGNPKGVVLTHRNILACVMSASQLLPHRPYRLVSLLPLSHMLEQVVGLYIPMLFGSTVTYARGRQPRSLVELMVRTRVTSMILVPQVLELMLQSIEREVKSRGREGLWRRSHQVARRLPWRLRRLVFRDVLRGLGGDLDFVICGGAGLDVGLAQTWEEMGVRVIQGYGMTECAPIVACNSYTNRELASVGAPAPGVRVRLSPEGEVLVAGENVTQGYWRNPEATKAAFTEDGWYRTGDLARKDDLGRLYIEGRLKDLIVLPNGMKVHPEDVEMELRKETAVADSVVLAVPDAAGRPEVHAVVIPAEGAAAPTAVRDAVRAASGRLAPHQRITAFTVWSGEDFPRTNLMKVKRHEVLATIREQRAAAPSGE